MTTVPKQIDIMLFETIKTIILYHQYSRMPLVKDLLDKGANPSAIFERTSSYEFVLRYNTKGEFSALLEEFEDHSINSHVRENDSIYEGLSVR